MDTELAAPGRNSESGLTLLGIVVVISVLITLAAVVVPNIIKGKGRSCPGEFVQLTEQLKVACRKHFDDTGRFPFEYTGTHYRTSRFHQLSMYQDYDGWSGPYLTESLTPDDNPWRGNLYLYRNLLPNGLQGWDLNCDGTWELKDRDAPGSVLWATDVPQEEARAVDQLIDGHGATDRWSTCGRVQWSQDRDGILWVLLATPDGSVD